MRFVVLFATVAVLSVSSIGCASATTRYVNPGDSIQDVVDVADPGDVIIVRDGTYTENVIVHRRLTIHSENGSAVTIVDAHNNDNGFAVLVDWVNISGFTVTNASFNGIDLNSVSHCDISDNILLSNNHNGIWMNNASNNRIGNNNASFSIMYQGIGMRNCRHNNITGNSLLSNNHNGIWMEDSDCNNITQNNASFSIMFQGIGMRNCSRSFITGNSMSSNNHNGLWMENSNNITITNNSAHNNNHSGVGMRACNHNSIEHNIVNANNQNGISLMFSNYNNITNNVASDNGQNGIALIQSPHNTLRGNVMGNNGNINLVFHRDDSLNDYDNDIDLTNLVNGLPVYHYYNQSDLVLDTINTRHISIAGCTNVTIRNNNMSNGDPLRLAFTKESIVESNVVSHNFVGIALMTCTNITVINNIANHNKIGGIYLARSVWNSSFYNNTVAYTEATGFVMTDSGSNKIINNTLILNNGDGIHLSNSNNNLISENNASNNLVYNGISLRDSKDNEISHNIANANNNNGICVYLNDYNNTVSYNIVNSNNDNGIYLSDSNNNTVIKNNASSNQFGIYVNSSNNNNISDNFAASNSDIGIKLDYSSYNDLYNNTVFTNGQYGIWLRRSPQNILRRNAMDHNGKFNLIHAESPDLEWWNDDIDASNTVNGLPIYYIYNKSNLIIDNYATKKLSIVGCENVTVKSINYSDGDPITISFTNNCRVEDCTVSNNNAGGFILIWSHNNTLANNSALNNEGNGIFLQADSSNNNITYNIITGNGQRGIGLQPLTFNNCIYNNYFDNSINAYDEGNNIWNITKTEERNIIGGPNLGGNYWSDYNGTDADGDGLGATPYDIQGGTNKDYLPLLAPPIFDTGKGVYPSIAGSHNGTIKLNHTITVSKLYTYPCSGTGGHTKHIKIWNATWPGVEAYWDGYQGDWRIISLPEFTLVAGETYNYTIRTGSYPQIIHAESKDVAGGTITCEEFVDINGKRQHEGWIPAIRLY